MSEPKEGVELKHPVGLVEVEAVELGLLESDPVTHPDTLKVDAGVGVAEVQTVEVSVGGGVWDPHPVEVGLKERVAVADPEGQEEGGSVPGMLPVTGPLIVSVGDWVGEVVVELDKQPLIVAVPQEVAEAAGVVDGDRVGVNEAQLEGECDTQVLGDPVPVEE